MSVDVCSSITSPPTPTLQISGKEDTTLNIIFIPDLLVFLKQHIFYSRQYNCNYESEFRKKSIKFNIHFCLHFELQPCACVNFIILNLIFFNAVENRFEY